MQHTEIVVDRTLASITTLCTHKNISSSSSLILRACKTQALEINPKLSVSEMNGFGHGVRMLCARY